MLSGPSAVRVPASGPNSPTWAPGVVLGSDGNPYRSPRDPLPKADKSRASQVYRDLAVAPFPLEWELPEIYAATTEHALGLFHRSGQLIDSMMGHPRIQSAIGARVGALLGLEEVYEQAEADTDGEVMQAWKQAWPLCHSPTDQGDVIGDIRRTTLLGGLHVSELVWDTEHESGLWQPFLKPWSFQHLYFDFGRRQLVAISEDGPIDVVPGDGRWFVHAPDGIYRGYINALVRALSLPFFLHNCAMRDWGRFSERHGQPILKASVPTIADDADKVAFESQLVEMGSEALVILPKGLDGEGFDLTLLEAASQSWEGFDRLMLRCENAITIAVQWQNLTTEVKEGSEAAARVHGDVKQTAVCLDDRSWSNDVNDQIARPFALWNFGDARKAPKTRRDVEVLEDQGAKLTALDTFARAVTTLRAAQVPVDVVALAAAYRIKLPVQLLVADGKPTIFGYHLAAGMVKVDEARERLGLPALGGDEGSRLLGAVVPGDTPPPTETAP